ncbi:MAG: phosphate signaling complex protein PhoU [Chloroflexota bacterium]
MSRKILDQEIQRARDEILILGSMVEQTTLRSVEALKDSDPEKSKPILEYDQKINEKRFDIEGSVIATIAMQQPAAHDLRVLASILKTCTELERMGDYAKGIAVINLRSGGLYIPKMLVDAHYMAGQIVNMLHRALTAFASEDTVLAGKIAREDILIDALYQQIYFEVMDYVVEDPANIEHANYILWVGHNLERMADRVKNICEYTIFIKTGEMIEDGTPLAANRR